MKRLTNCTLTAAAVLLVTAGVASAQTIMKAEVPFAFSVGNKVMEPGTIRVGLLSMNSGSPAIVVNNHDAKRSYIVLPKSNGDAPKKWIESGEPKLGFDCSTGACVPVQVLNGRGTAYTVHGPRTRSGETLLTEIVMKPDKAE